MKGTELILEVVAYGKSMYGGWYVNYNVVDAAGYIVKRTGAGFDTFRELRKWAQSQSVNLLTVTRYDND